MKKIIAIVAISALAFVSCKKEDVCDGDFGTLSFTGMTLEQDDALVTKAVSAASGNYTVIILDAEDNEVVKTSYSAIKENGNSISLAAGNYTLVARSTEDNVPVAAFEQPVYGTSAAFSISAGETTTMGNLTCTLLQCKVTVSYSDDFLAMVTGDCTADVVVTSGYPLTYGINCGTSVTYDQSAGYFAVKEGSTMEVKFTGQIEGKKQSQTKVFTHLAPRQWRQVKFIKKVDQEGNATFDILIDDYVDDAQLNNFVDGSESVIGDDPKAPKGDGDMALSLASGCSPCFTDLTNLVIPAPADPATPDVCLKLRLQVPNGIKKFTVNIDSTSEAFTSAVEAADATSLDLINPSETNMIIFQVVPFPYGQEVVGQTDITFDLSNAQCAIYLYKGVHNFNMVVVDQKGCKKEMPVVMVVE